MFSRSTPAPAPRAKPARGATPGLSFIAAEAVVSGNLATRPGPCRGRVDGDVKFGQLSRVRRDDRRFDPREDARLAGTVEGTVSARTLIVEASAKILGDVAYETISIEAGAQIEGRLARRAALGLEDDSPRLAAPVSFSPARQADDAPDQPRLTIPDPAAGRAG